MKMTAIILAAGIGSRFGGKKPKQFSKVGNNTILDITVEKFKDFDQIIVVFNNDFKEEYSLDKTIELIPGGKTRKESLDNALKEVRNKMIVIHECARYKVDVSIIGEHVKKISNFPAINTMIETRDTLFKIEDGKVVEEIGKNKIYSGQNPQSYNLNLLPKNFINAYREIEDDLDLCSFAIKQGVNIEVINGNKSCDKVTYPGDL